MAIGTGLCDADTAQMVVDASSVDHVDSLCYLGSFVDSTSRSSFDTNSRITAASKAFGALQQPVFRNTHLSVSTKRYIFFALVLSVLLYGAKCWGSLAA